MSAHSQNEGTEGRKYQDPPHPPGSHVSPFLHGWPLRYGKVETLASFNSRESFRLLLMQALGSVSLCSHLLLFKTIQDATECHSPVLRSKRKVFTWYFQNKCLHNPVIALHSLTLNSFCHCSALLLPMPSHGQRTANPRGVCYWFCALIFTGDNPFLPPWYYTH